MGHGDDEAAERGAGYQELRPPPPREEHDQAAQQADLEHGAALGLPADQHVVADHQQGEAGADERGDGLGGEGAEGEPLEDEAERAHRDLDPVGVAQRVAALGVVDGLEQHGDADREEKEPEHDPEPVADLAPRLLDVRGRGRFRRRASRASARFIIQTRHRARTPGLPAQRCSSGIDREVEEL